MDIFDQAQQAQAQQAASAAASTTIDVDPDTGDVKDMTVEGFTRVFDKRSDAIDTLDALDEMGWQDKYSFDVSTKTLTLVNVSDRELDILQRKTKIRGWSKKTIGVANAVSAFATDIADYTLNGAVAPTIGAVSNAALTTGRVVATAGVKASAMVLASAIRNGRQAATEIRHSKEVNEAWAEVKGLGSDIASAIFGATPEGSNSGWTRVSA